MMLGLVLMTHNDGRRLELGLRRLALAMQAGAKVLVIDAGSQDGTSARLQAFADGPGRGADILRSDAARLDRAAAHELARDRLGTPYVLGLSGQDLICPDAIAPLVARLEAGQPDLMIANHGWWVAGPGSVLPCADAARMAALAGQDTPARGDLHDLLADPRRLLSGPGCAVPQAGSDPAQAWEAYDTALEQAGRVAVFGDPVVLRPIPEDHSAALFTLVQARLRACPGKERRALLARLLRRLGDEMAFCAPQQADEILRAAGNLRRALPWRLRRAADALPGPAAALLGALHRGGPGSAAAGLGVLAHLASTQDRARLLALSGEIRALREDLDLALPGEDYLLELYEKVRLT